MDVTEILQVEDRSLCTDHKNHFGRVQQDQTTGQLQPAKHSIMDRHLHTHTVPDTFSLILFLHSSASQDSYKQRVVRCSEPAVWEPAF